MVARVMSDFLNQLLAINGSRRFPEHWQGPRRMVVMVWRLMRVSTMVVMMVVCGMGDEA
jgi:hypothetical protein